MTTLIKCPTNYVGGKTKLLPQILPLFPTKINRFIDLFGGGFNVGINVTAESYVYNDIVSQISSLMEMFEVTPYEEMLLVINEIIDEYQLSNTNNDGYLKLREFYNSQSPKDPLILFILICHSFNNQVRFNKKGGFNYAFGKRSFNLSTKVNLEQFSNRLKQINVSFYSDDFRTLLNNIDVSSNDFIYADPPYLISGAAYNNKSNISGGWSENDERELLSLLDNLNDSGIKWALSNVLENNNMSNDMLKTWSLKYDVTHLNHSYNNCMYHRKDKTNGSDEVLIRNYI